MVHFLAYQQPTAACVFWCRPIIAPTGPTITKIHGSDHAPCLTLVSEDVLSVPCVPLSYLGKCCAIGCCACLRRLSCLSYVAVHHNFVMMASRHRFLEPTTRLLCNSRPLSKISHCFLASVMQVTAQLVQSRFKRWQSAAWLLSGSRNMLAATASAKCVTSRCALCHWLHPD